MTAYVYFALDLVTQRIKIGCSRGTYFSVCPVVRVRSLGEKVQFLGCLPLKQGARDWPMKRELHTKFSDSHDEGDWFFPSQALRDYIQAETRGHICELCAGETTGKRKASNSAANASVIPPLRQVS